MRGLAKISVDAGDGKLLFTCTERGARFIPVANLRRVFYLALKKLNRRIWSGELDDITTCPCAWDLQSGLTKFDDVGGGAQ